MGRGGPSLLWLANTVLLSILERSRSRRSAAVRNGLLVSSLLRPYLPDVYAPATTTLHQPSRNWSLVLLPPPARVTRPAAPPALARGRGMRRIALSSVPRSGNGWLRRLLEVGSSVATCSTWPEFGTLQQPHNCYFHDHPCGSDARGIEGWSAEIERHPRPPVSGPCTAEVAKLSLGVAGQTIRLPQLDEPYFVKAHYPFYAHSLRATFNLSTDVFAIVVVRNPVDNYAAYRRYMTAERPVQIETFIQGYLAHHYFWLHAMPEIPRAVLRFEDLQADPQGEMRRLAAQLPAGLTFDFDRLALSAPTKVQLGGLHRFGYGLSDLSHEEAGLLADSLGELMAQYGYRLERRADGDRPDARDQALMDRIKDRLKALPPDVAGARTVYHFLSKGDFY